MVDNGGDLADLERQIDAIWPELVERGQPEEDAAAEQRYACVSREGEGREAVPIARNTVPRPFSGA